MRTYLALLLLASGACSSPSIAQPGERVALGFLAPGEQATGVALEPTTGHPWYLVAGRGLVEADARGALISEIRYGERGLVLPAQGPGASSAPADLGFRADGDLVLSAATEGYLYDPSAETLSPYFCLEPPLGGQETRNDAIAIDDAGGRIFAAPVTTDRSQAGAMVADQLALYATASGAPVVDHDLAGGFVAKGFAWDAAAQELLAVSGGTLARVGLDGAIGDEVELAGVGDAQGVYLDPAGVHVLDAAGGVVTTFARTAR